jgi:hypothetical protein
VPEVLAPFANVRLVWLEVAVWLLKAPRVCWPRLALDGRPAALFITLTLDTAPPKIHAHAQALTPVVEGIISQDMQRFKEYATAYAAAQASSQQQQHQQQAPKA